MKRKVLKVSRSASAHHIKQRGTVAGPSPSKTVFTSYNSLSKTLTPLGLSVARCALSPVVHFFLPGGSEADREMSASISVLAASAPSLLVYWLMNKQTVARFVCLCNIDDKSANPRDACYHPSALN